jgi:hypothetical protein
MYAHLQPDKTRQKILSGTTQIHSLSQNATPLPANVFSTGIHRLPVINTQRPDFTLRKPLSSSVS